MLAIIYNTEISNFDVKYIEGNLEVVKGGFKTCDEYYYQIEKGKFVLKGNGGTTKSSTKEFDKYGRITKLIYFSSNQVIKCTYGSNNKISEEKLGWLDKKTNGIKPGEIHLFNYDESNKILEKKTNYPDGSPWSATKFDYLQNGKEIIVSTYDKNDEESSLTFKSTFHYNDKNHIVKLIEEHWTEDYTKRYYENKYKYNEKGLISECLQISSFTYNGKTNDPLEMKYTYKYDNNDKLIEEYVYQNKFLSHIIRYKYGNMISKTANSEYEQPYSKNEYKYSK